MRDQAEAVYVGAVGPRFERPNLMEWQEMISRKQSERSDNSSIVNLFLKFYSKKMNLEFYEKLREYSDLQGTLDAAMYIERIGISAETFLIEANQRGKSKKLNALQTI